MLYSESFKLVTEIPYREQFDHCRAQLSDAQYQAIVDTLNAKIDRDMQASGEGIQTSSWIPGANWTGTVYDPIYSQACGRDEELSAKFFGQIVWKVFIDRPEHWASAHYEKDGIPIKGRTYFRVHPETNNSKPD